MWISVGEPWSEVVVGESLGVSEMYCNGWVFVVVCG